MTRRLRIFLRRLQDADMPFQSNESNDSSEASTCTRMVPPFDRMTSFDDFLVHNSSTDPFEFICEFYLSIH